MLHPKAGSYETITRTAKVLAVRNADGVVCELTGAAARLLPVIDGISGTALLSRRLGLTEEQVLAGVAVLQDAGLLDTNPAPRPVRLPRRPVPGRAPAPIPPADVHR